jgi:hypothetical protein
MADKTRSDSDAARVKRGTGSAKPRESSPSFNSAPWAPRCMKKRTAKSPCDPGAANRELKPPAPIANGHSYLYCLQAIWAKLGRFCAKRICKVSWSIGFCKTGTFAYLLGKASVPYPVMNAKGTFLEARMSATG